MSDLVNHPIHYNVSASVKTRDILVKLYVHNRVFDMECIEVIDYLQELRYFEFCEFEVYNAIKYLWRYKNITDLQKARWYLERSIQMMKPRLQFHSVLHQIAVKIGVKRDEYSNLLEALSMLDTLISKEIEAM